MKPIIRLLALLLVLPGAALGVRAQQTLRADGPAADPYANLRYYYPVPKANPPRTITVDVCVYGATPAGVTAAIQATRMGKRAALVEFGRHLGGLTASGLSKTDGGKTAAGIATEFYAVVGKSDFTPAAAEAQFRAMLQRAGVQVFTEHRLARVEKEGAAITRIVMENDNAFAAKMFIDATYEGDLLARAGVSYTVGREANAQYGETLNGIHKPGSHNFRLAVDPYLVPGDPASGALPEITSTAPDAPGKIGEGDKRIQAYNFRMFLTKAADRIPFPRPRVYDPARYEILARYIQAGAQIKDFMQLQLGDSNNEGGFSTDFIGKNYAWPEAGYAEREKIYQDHVNYQMGLMYFVTHDPRVPAEMREKISAFGLAPANFKETGGWPHQLYIREARRMISDTVMTENNCRAKVVAPDSVGLAEYNMDSHNCQRFIERTGGKAVVRNEGDVQIGPAHPYEISYRSIVPREKECPNLLVPVCLSCTHIAYGSIRMEPVFMVLGQSAGTAAALAIDGGTSAQQVPYAKLRARLLADKQNLDYVAPRNAAAKKAPAKTK